MFAEYLQTFIDQCLAGPVLPATIVIGLVVMYGALVILGTLDFDLIDVDLDVDADADVTSLGFVALKFLNIGEVPLMIWLCVFSLCWWLVSLMFWTLWDQAGYAGGGFIAARLVLRNAAVGVLATKICTNPLAKVFAKPLQFKPTDMLGRVCTITTFEATHEYGQARYKTEAAPMLMNVKTLEGTLQKGDRARVVDYDPDAGVYFVELADAPPASQT